MCVQCAIGAMTAGTAATGIKAFIEVRAPWLLSSATAMRAAKFVLAAVWVLTAGLFGAGSG